MSKARGVDSLPMAGVDRPDFHPYVDVIPSDSAWGGTPAPIPCLRWSC
jgi:hypothetical protein